MDLSQGLNAFLNKVSDLLGIFDLSFFISGAVCAGAVALGLYKSGVPLEVIDQTGFKIPVVIFACYVLGLICFAAGRLIRRELLNLLYCDKMEEFGDVLKAHQLDRRNPFKTYISQWKMDSLYSRFWVQLRGDQRLASSLGLLDRYWVMTATCDGVAMAMLVWAWVIHRYFNSGFAAIFVLLALVSFKEATRLVKYQIEDLVATVVYWQEHDCSREDNFAAGKIEEE